jgi:hypothetical protein
MAKKAHEAPRPEGFDADEILEEIKILSRAPFQRPLARLIAAEPTQAELAAFARKSPDRWGQVIAIFARGSGFSDKIDLDVDVNIAVKISRMSDAEKLRLIAEYEAKLKSIDVTPAESESREVARRKPPDKK